MIFDTGRVNFTLDGLGLTPFETCGLLQMISGAESIRTDTYSIGGVVRELEEEFSRLLGKEAAVFMPSGTLANHIALRQLCGTLPRILVQPAAHIYRDSGDCMQQLSGKNMIPLISPSPEAGAAFTLDQVHAAVQAALGDKVATGIGAISIESPVRRMNGVVFPREEMEKIAAYARNEGIGLHLDGARLLIACAWYDISPAEYAGLFDTVYVSLYKYLNAPFGAILAGDRAIIDGLYHERRMFGGGLNQVWLAASLALHALKSFATDYREVIKRTGRLAEMVTSLEGFGFDSIPMGTNVFRLRLPEHVDPEFFRTSLEGENILLPTSEKAFNGFFIKTNESLLSADLDTIGAAFSRFV